MTSLVGLRSIVDNIACGDTEMLYVTSADLQVGSFDNLRGNVIGEIPSVGAPLSLLASRPSVSRFL